MSSAENFIQSAKHYNSLLACPTTWVIPVDVIVNCWMCGK